MEFTKMHGAGNDFIVINNIEMKIPEAKLGQLAEIMQTPFFHRSRRVHGHRLGGIRRRLQDALL